MFYMVQAGSTPPDPAICVGNGFIIEIVNTGKPERLRLILFPIMAYKRDSWTSALLLLKLSSSMEIEFFPSEHCCLV